MTAPYFRETLAQGRRTAGACLAALADLTEEFGKDVAQRRVDSQRLVSESRELLARLREPQPRSEVMAMPVYRYFLISNCALKGSVDLNCETASDAHAAGEKMFSRYWECDAVEIWDGKQRIATLQRAAFAPRTPYTSLARSA